MKEKKTRSRTRYEKLSKKAKINEGRAWWYANRRNIELHIAKGSGPAHYVILLPLAKLKEYVRRMTVSKE